VGHHDIHSEKWTVLDIHFEGVIKHEGHVTFKPMISGDLNHGEVDRSEEVTQTSGSFRGVWRGRLG
jgi:hypothetical protein